MGRPKQVNGSTYIDDVYQDVNLELIGGLGRSIYKITNEGQYKGKVVHYDLEDKVYYETYYDEEKSLHFHNGIVFDISRVSSGIAVKAEPLTVYDNIGENGKGVGFVKDDTTLRTSGLNTCVGWLLYNDKAAYLTHIVVLTPKTVLANGSIANQVAKLCKLFSEAVGSLPTHLVIKVDEDQPAYKTSLWKSGWMKELVPSTCEVEVEWRRGAGNLEHVVYASKGTSKDWDGFAINVNY